MKSAPIESLKYLTEQERAELDALISAPPSESYADWYRRTAPPTFGFPRHIQFLCDLVQRVVDGEITRLAISTPPGHAKSDTITRRLPNYWAPRHPHDAIVLTGYSQRFADKSLSYPTREIARELGILGDATALDEWEFINGARLVSRGVGSAPTGINPIGLFVGDDPLKDRAQANSAVERENMHQWWNGSIVQRFWPRTRALIIATRWHHDDLIGRLKAQNDGTWTFVNLPAIAGEDDPMGRAPGEALWPEEKPLEFLEQQRQAMGDFEFEALFQGNPTPREGAMFKVSQIEIIDTAPEGLSPVRAWDIGAGGLASDPTAGVLMGTDGKRFYVLDVAVGQWFSDERDRMILQTAQMDGVGVKVWLPQDPGAAGKSLAEHHVRMLAGFNVHTAPVTGDKVTRADPFSAQVNAGNVCMVRGAWNRAFVEELRTFPMGVHDDQVDAASDAFNRVARQKRAWVWA